jgi:hypothetical protein
MVALVAFVLAVYGAAAAVTVLEIGTLVRHPALALARRAEGRRVLGWLTDKAAKFVHCPACVGFWLGCACSAWIYRGPSGIWYVDGFVALGATWIIHVILIACGMYRTDEEVRHVRP